MGGRAFAGRVVDSSYLSLVHEAGPYQEFQSRAVPQSIH